MIIFIIMIIIFFIGLFSFHRSFLVSAFIAQSRAGGWIEPSMCKIRNPFRFCFRILNQTRNSISRSTKVQLGAWPGGSWLPWRAAPWLLFLLFVFVGVCEWDFFLMVLLASFTFSPAHLLTGPYWSQGSRRKKIHLLTCTMGFAPIKRTCTIQIRQFDEDSLLTGP